MEKVYAKQAAQLVTARSLTDDAWCGSLVLLTLEDNSQLYCDLPGGASFCLQNYSTRTLNCVTKLNIDQ